MGSTAQTNMGHAHTFSHMGKCRAEQSSLLADAAFGEACTAFCPGHLHLGTLVDGLLGDHQGWVSQHKLTWVTQTHVHLGRVQSRAAHLLMPPLVRRARPSVLDIFILEPLLRACWETVRGGFHSTKHFGPWGEPSSEITSTCSTPVTRKV